MSHAPPEENLAPPPFLLEKKLLDNIAVMSFWLSWKKCGPPLAPLEFFSGLRPCPGLGFPSDLGDFLNFSLLRKKPNFSRGHGKEI